MDGLIQIGVSAFIIILAMITGSILEKKHYASIKEREDKFRNLPAIPSAEYDFDHPVAETRMVCGSVVISIDYFKRFLANLRNIFGGEVKSYESLLDRGRREAVLRMKEEYPDADIIVNLRMETSSVSQGSMNSKNNSLGSVEVLAYGTAVRYQK